MGSPLMRLSGMELKYRLGHGDQTLDQVLYIEENLKTSSMNTHRSNSMEAKGSHGFEPQKSSQT